MSATVLDTFPGNIEAVFRLSAPVIQFGAVCPEPYAAEREKSNSAYKITLLYQRYRKV